MHKRHKGFTIVELLIVIVVIGILATITVVAYNNITQRADNSRRLSNLKQWSTLIRTYQVINGGDFRPTELADNADTLGIYYCLGENFPHDNLCWNAWDEEYATPESPSLMAELKTVGTLPSQYYTDDNLPDGFGYGPIVAYNDDGSLSPTSIEYISDWFHGTTCPSGTVYHWSSEEYNVATCRIVLDDNS